MAFTGKGCRKDAPSFLIAARGIVARECVCGCEIRADANDVRRVPVVRIAVVVDIAGVGGRLHAQNRKHPKRH